MRNLYLYRERTKKKRDIELKNCCPVIFFDFLDDLKDVAICIRRLVFLFFRVIYDLTSIVF